MKKILFEIKQRLSVVYWEWKNIKVGWPGKVAQKYKVPVGTIGCPYCGITRSGALDSPVCGFCGKGYWEDIKL